MITLKVDGMSCGHCVRTVTEAVEALPSVERVQVDLEAGLVTVAGSVQERAIRQAIEEAGYEVRDAG